MAAFATFELQQHGFEHRFGGHERAAHVRVQGGWQVKPIDQIVFGEVGEVMARLLATRARRAHDGDLRQRRIELAQCLPLQAQFAQG